MLFRRRLLPAQACVLMFIGPYILPPHLNLPLPHHYRSLRVPHHLQLPNSLTYTPCHEFRLPVSLLSQTPIPMASRKHSACRSYN